MHGWICVCLVWKRLVQFMLQVWYVIIINDGVDLVTFFVVLIRALITSDSNNRAEEYKGWYYSSLCI